MEISTVKEDPVNVSIGVKIMRLAIGMLLVVALVVAVFAMLSRWAPTWGATEADVARTLPGDELIPRAPSDWTHAMTIDAPPEKVWPWLAQIGDDRGGFYSYTFIENPAQKMMMGGEPVYHNANRILPQFQNPRPGEGMIMDALQVYDVEPGKWLLAAQRSEAGKFEWVWLWYLEPAGTDQTRLLVRSAMRLALGPGNPAVSTVMGLGAFVMNWRSIEGIKLRAEGGTEPAGIEIMEILLWVAALAVELGAGVLFVTRRAWLAPLLLGLGALLALMWFTFWLPSIWLRLLVDIALFALLWWVARRTKAVPVAARSERTQAPGLQGRPDPSRRAESTAPEPIIFQGE
jgi:hypothetical protein